MSPGRNGVILSYGIFVSYDTSLIPRIVCTSKIGNLPVQVGVPPGVGSGYGRFGVLRAGPESA